MGSPLRLLGFGNSYRPEVIGGYPEVSADVMEALAARGHRVTMLVSPRTLPAGAPGPPDSRVELKRELDYVLAAWRHPVKGLRAVAHDDGIVRAALAAGVDAAIVWHMRGVMKTSLRLLHEAGIPVLYMVHDRWVLYERAGPWLRPWPLLDRLGVNVPRELVARLARPRVELGAPPIEREGINCFVTQWLEDEYRRLGWRPRIAHVIRGGFDLRPFAAAANYDPARAPRRLVFAGRVDWRKGLDVAVEGIAASGVPYSLSVAGPVDDDAYAQRVDRIARERGLEPVTWLGPVPRAELPQLFAASDAMVYPSVEPESYGLGLIEAMATGLPVITSAQGGPREYLRDRDNALLFDPKDVAGMAAALSTLDADPGLRARLRASAAETASHHDLEPVTARIDALLREVVG